MMRIVILAFLIGLIIPVYSQTIITDRPDQTESSSTIEKGHLQIESGLLIGYLGENADQIRQFAAPSSLFRLGITGGVELRVFHQMKSIKQLLLNNRHAGINDIEVGTKIQLLRNPNVNTEIAFLSHIILPTGSEGLSNEKFGSINKLSIAHNLGENTSIGYNIGYNNFGLGSGDLTYSAAFGLTLTDRVGLYLEPYGDLVEFKDHIANFNAGGTYLLKDNLQLDFSFGFGLNHNMNYLSTGVSWFIL